MDRQTDTIDTEADDDGFDTAFDSFSVPEGKKEEAADDELDDDDAADDEAVVAEGDDAEGDDAAADGDDADTEDDAEEGEADDGDDDDGAEVDEEEEEEAPAAKDDSDDVLARLSEMVAKAKKDAEPEKREEPAKGAADEEEDSVFDSDEQKFLAEYEEEWSDVSKGEALKRRAEYKALLGHVFGQVAEYLKPMEQTMRVLAERAHTSDLEETVEGYSDNLREEVMGWVEKQPSYLQTAYKQVIESGTPEEVGDLVQRFRGDTGKATSSKKSPVKKKKDAELSDTAKKAASELAPVGSRRSVIPKDEDKADFDDAFERFAGREL